MRIKFAMQVWAANEIKKWKRQKKILKKENKGIFPQPPKSSYFSKSKIFLITKQGEKYGKILFVLLLLLRSASQKLCRFVEWKVMPCCWLVFFLLMIAQDRAMRITLFSLQSIMFRFSDCFLHSLPSISSRCTAKDVVPSAWRMRTKKRRRRMARTWLRDYFIVYVLGCW